MMSPTLLSYIGTGTGIIGALTGIAGSVMGYLGLRRTGQIKSLDLRLELRKAERGLRGILNDLPEFLSRAKQSRYAVASANGGLQSGWIVGWTQAWEADLEKIRQLEGDLPDQGSDLVKATHYELESRLVVAHTMTSQASGLQAKYQASIAEDDVMRQRIHEAVAMRAAGR